MSGERVDELVAGFLEARARGESPDPDELVARHPSVAGLLRERLSSLAAVDDCLGLLRSAAPARAEVPPPDIPGYRVLRRLGQGGMGVVFLAEQEGLKRLVALKILPPHWGADARGVERFRREAETIARLSHPGIVAVHQFGEHRGVLYLALEYVPGLDLQSLLSELRREKSPSGEAMRRAIELSAAKVAGHGLRMPAAAPSELWTQPYPRLCAALVKSVAETLQALHSQGVLHRDIKPSNIIVGLDGVPRLIDFGLTLSDEGSALTRPHDFLGSAPYSSPEQVEGSARGLGPASEVFSLGAVLYELLTLKRAFDGSSLTQILSQVSAARVPEMRGVPAGLAHICRQALARDPKRRYPRAQAFADDLQSYLDGTPIRAQSRFRLKRAAQLAGISMAAGLAWLAGRREKPAETPSPPAAAAPAPAPNPMPAPPPARPKPVDPLAAMREQARSHLEAKRYHEAGEAFARVLEKAPMELASRVAYAESLSRAGQAEAAERQFELALAQSPMSPLALQGYGAALARHGDLAGAVRQYKKSLDPSSTDAKAHLLIAELLAGLSRDEEALYYYSRASKLAKTDEERALAAEGLSRLKR